MLKKYIKIYQIPKARALVYQSIILSDKPEKKIRFSIFA